MNKIKSAKINKVLKHRKLKPFLKYFNSVKISYGNKVLNVTGFDIYRRIININDSYYLNPVTFIHEITHFKDYYCNKRICTIPSPTGYHIDYYINEKEYKLLKETLFKDIEIKEIERIMSKLEGLFNRYKYKEHLQAMLIDIFNSISGGKYSIYIYGNVNTHNYRYYKDNVKRFIEVNANFTALTSICGYDKIKRIFTELKYTKLYDNLYRMHKIVSREYI